MSTETMHTDLRLILIAYSVTLIAAAIALAILPFSALWNALIADVIATTVIFLFSRHYKNSSFYDAYWSVIPPLLMLYWIFTGDNSGDNRVWLVFALVSFWAIRLTWNWASHWQGLVHEDWRYQDLRTKAGPGGALLVDFVGIHLLPTLQVFAACLPLYIICHFPGAALHGLDIVAGAVTFGAVVIEWRADIQLHRFLKTRQPGDIINTGLWAWSRHPNYFGELSFWCGLMLFGLAASPAHFFWLIPGSILMAAMFIFISIPMMDKRSAASRPGYSEHMKQVSGLMLLPPRQRS